MTPTSRGALCATNLVSAGSGDGGGLLPLLVLLERSHEGHLVLRGLEATVAELGAGVDELEVDLLKSPLLGVGEQRLPQGEGPLLGSNAAAL